MSLGKCSLRGKGKKIEVRQKTLEISRLTRLLVFYKKPFNTT